jgi:hypothetical protein
MLGVPRRRPTADLFRQTGEGAVTRIFRAVSWSRHLVSGVFGPAEATLGELGIADCQGYYPAAFGLATFSSFLAN